MTAEEQKKMQELEAENAALKERLLVAQRTLAKYAQMLFGQKTERCRLPEKPEELTGSLFDHPFYKINAKHFFCDTMFHLKSCIYLKEIKPFCLVII